MKRCKNYHRFKGTNIGQSKATATGSEIITNEQK